MREHDVFGHKLSKMRPFYFVIALFIIIIPLHFVMDFFQQQTLNQLNDDYQALRSEINMLLDEYEAEVNEDIHLGMIYSGFENDGFNIYIEERIETIMYASDLGQPTSLDISIQNDVASPFTITLSEDIVVNKINLVIETDDMDDVIDFIQVLTEQDKLYYVDTLNYSLLTNDDYRITIQIYSFYLDS